MKSAKYFFPKIVLFSFILLAPVGVIYGEKKLPPLHPDRFFSEKISLETAIGKLDKTYLKKKKEATQRYARSKKKVGRSLGAMTISAAKKKRQEKKATKSYQQELDYLKKEYRRSRKILNSRYKKQKKKKKTARKKKVVLRPNNTKPKDAQIAAAEAKFTRSLRTELRDLQVSCFDEDRAARRDFRREKRKADRSLGALERRVVDRRTAVNKAQKKLARMQTTANNKLSGSQQKIRQNMRSATQEAIQDVKETSDLIEAWGTEPGQLMQLPPEQRLELAQKLAGKDKLKKLASMLGRFRRMAIHSHTSRPRTPDQVIPDAEGASACCEPVY